MTLYGFFCDIIWLYSSFKGVLNTLLVKKPKAVLKIISQSIKIPI